MSLDLSNAVKSKLRRRFFLFAVDAKKWRQSEKAHPKTLKALFSKLDSGRRVLTASRSDFSLYVSFALCTDTARNALGYIESFRNQKRGVSDHKVVDPSNPKKRVAWQLPI